MRVLKPVVYALIAAVAVAQSSLRAAEPDILKQVPADAQVVFIIPSLSGLSDKVTKLAQSLNLPQPEMQDPLAQVKALMGLNQGLNESGGLALVIPTIVIGGQPEGVLLLPVSDYKAFVANFGVPNAGEGITPIEFQGQQVFVKKLGGYAVLSNQRHVVDAYKTPTQAGLGGRAGKLGSAILGRGDAVLFIDITQIGPMFQPIVQMQMEQAKMQMQIQGIPQAAQMAGMIDLVSAAMQAVMRDGQSVVIGADISDAGVGLNLSTQFKSGSSLATMFGQTPSELAFDRLPDKPYFLASSFSTRALPLDKWLSQFSAKLPADVPFAKVIQSSIDVMRLAGDQIQGAVYPPNLGAGGGLFNTVNVYTTTDPDKFIAENRKMLEQLNNLDLGGGATIRTQYEENAVQIEGVKRVDRFRQQTQLPPEAMAQLGLLAGMIGQEQSGFVAPVKGAVVIAAGADPTALKDIITVAGGGGKLADRGIKSIRPHLLGSRAVENYVGVGALVQFANSFLSLMAPQFVIQVPADLPPVASSVSVDSGGLGSSLFIPLPVMQLVKNTVDKFQGGGAGSGTTGGTSSLPTGNRLITTLTDANFESQVLQSTLPVLVDFYAVWSSQCKAQAPVIDDLARKYDGRLKVGRIDVDENLETTDLYGVEAYPTVLLFKQGVKVAEFAGLTPADKIEQAVQKALQ